MSEEKDDLVERLRHSAYGAWNGDLMYEAADEIERLRNRVKELEEWEDLWMAGP